MTDPSSSRQFQRYAAPRENSFTTELSLIVFTIFSGLCGLWAESVYVTATIFGGGVLTWFAYTFPDHLRKQAEQQQQLPPPPPPPPASAQPDTKGDNGGKPAPAAHLAPDATFALIAGRRSVKGRDYDGQPVDRQLVERVLEAANWAPTHKMTQPWRFVVLEGAAKGELLDRTEAAVLAKGGPPDKSEAFLKKLGEKRKTLAKVPYLIALGMKAQAVAGVHVVESEELCATACAVQNMALMATSLGLAGFWDSWTAARDSPDLKAWLGLLPEDKCLGVFYLGHTERLASYRGSRGHWQDKVTWRS